jgi:hypothetical protein
LLATKLQLPFEHLLSVQATPSSQSESWQQLRQPTPAQQRWPITQPNIHWPLEQTSQAPQSAAVWQPVACTQPGILEQEPAAQVSLVHEIPSLHSLAEQQVPQVAVFPSALRQHF